MKTIYVLGNPIEPLDRMPYRILPALKQTFPYIRFTFFDPTENLGDVEGKRFIGIDTVAEITSVCLITDIESLLLSPRYTVHDYDVAVDLRILQKLKKIESVTIIGVPQRGKKLKIAREAIAIAKSIGL